MELFVYRRTERNFIRCSTGMRQHLKQLSFVKVYLLCTEIIEI